MTLYFWVKYWKLAVNVLYSIGGNGNIIWNLEVHISYPQICHLQPITSPFPLPAFLPSELNKSFPVWSQIHYLCRWAALTPRNNYKSDPFAASTRDPAKAWENAADTARWPLFPDLWAYRLDPPGVKIAVFPLGQFFRLKVKPALTQSAVTDWASLYRLRRCQSLWPHGPSHSEMNVEKFFIEHFLRSFHDCMFLCTVEQVLDISPLKCFSCSNSLSGCFYLYHSVTPVPSHQLIMFFSSDFLSDPENKMTMRVLITFILGSLYIWVWVLFSICILACSLYFSSDKPF